MSRVPPSLLIVGLRRSGTTALWELFRSAPSVRAFDEPFHPRLWEGARDNHKRTWSELTALWSEGPGELARGVRPIAPLDELAPDMSTEQEIYVRTLGAQDGPVVMDEVRTWNKLPALAQAMPNAHIVLLVRSPVPWVLSHLLPSGGSGWRFAMGSRVRRATALRRRRGFDNWQYETIFDAMLDARHSAFEAVPISCRAPAYEKLLALWWACNRRSWQDLCRAVPAHRFDVLLAEDFMCAPRFVADWLTARATLGVSEPLAYESVRAPRSDPLQADPAWTTAFRKLGIPSFLLPQARPDGAVLQDALEAPL